MQAVRSRVARFAGMVAISAALAACGGSGGSNDAPPPPPADARNGDYTMVAADARVYTLALDFDAKTYRVTGDSVDASGALQEDAGTYLFVPGNGTGTSGASTLRFQMASDTAVGEFALPSGAVPFIAPRKFVTSVADAAGVYNILGRTVDTAGGTPTNTAQQGEITADGHLRTCDDVTIFDMANCPSASITTGTVTVSGDVFTAAIAAGNIPFRVAQVGADKVFLRASASAGTTRRFLVGVPAATSFADGTFVGGTTEPAWGKIVVAAPNVTSTATLRDGSTSTMTGTVASTSFAPGIASVDAGSAGVFFAVRSSELGVLAANMGSTTAQGFIAIGRKQ